MDLRFMAVDSSNRAQVEALSLLLAQKGYIESVTECLAEADGLDVWRPVGIYDGDLLVGFAMYGLFLEQPVPDRVWLDRLLIDCRYQGKGYGKNAVLALLKRLREEYRCDEVYLSVYDDNETAIHLYEQAGFRFNGELDTKGEKVMVSHF